jgi:endo-1,4-beta-xylanase
MSRKPLRMAPLKPLAILLSFGAAACGTGESPSQDGSGGSATGGRGGTSASGGAATGGTRTTGGSSGMGGSSGTGGSSARGGSSTGGSSTGGSATAGSGGTGNAPCTNVRPTGTDWDDATCEQWATESEECDQAWMVDNNYCNESCGRCSNGSGGSGGSGGTGGSTGGSGPAVTIPPSGCSEGERMVCNNQTQMHCGYTSEYWKDQGTGCMINTADGFSIDWTDVNNLLARKGIRPGSADLVVTFDAEYAPDGTSYLNVYGWMQNPLVEYYIVDSWRHVRDLPD